jgi:hypothetical protein
MKTGALLVLIAAAHVTFLVLSYGRHLLQVLPYGLALIVWTVLSTAVACTLNYSALPKTLKLSTRGFLAAALGIISLVLGVVVAFNLYGT